MNYKLLQGDCLEVLKTLPDNSVVAACYNAHRLGAVTAENRGIAKTGVT